MSKSAQISCRIDAELYARLLEYIRTYKERTGIELTSAQVIRAALEQYLGVSP